MKLANKVAIVTGAASGIGKEIARLYAKEGAQVVVADVNEAGIQATVAAIENDGGQAMGVVANIGQKEAVQQMIQTAVDTYGTLDILVNNAGVMDNMMPAHKVTDDLWEWVFSINVTGLMQATREALAIFLEKGSGVIVNTASAAGVAGSRAGAAYTASKHAVIGYTKNVGFQYAEKGIRCNAIAPGGVNTNIGTTMSEPDDFGIQRAMSGAANNPRNGDPEEIAKVALFLASGDSSYVNATVIRADLGWTSY